jgi:hypothetical protein
MIRNSFIYEKNLLISDKAKTTIIPEKINYIDFVSDNSDEIYSIRKPSNVDSDASTEIYHSTIHHKEQNKPICNETNKILPNENNNYTENDNNIDTIMNMNINTNNKIKIQNNSYHNKFILDPLSVIIKLAILSNKQIGTKLCIYNNVAYIQEPGIFQPFIRYFYKNNKDDLFYLYNPIEIACSHFLKNNPEIEIKKLFLHAKKGIEFLMNHYKDSKTILHTLIMYYNIISNHLSHSFNKDLFIPDNVSEIYTSNLIEFLNSKWNYTKIKMVLDIIDFIDNNDENKKSIKCLDEFMVDIDDENQKIISKHFS